MTQTPPSGQAPTLNSEWLFAMDLDIAYDRLQAVGAMPGGWRGIYPVNGGLFEGPKLKGRVMPDGADWVVRRADGATTIDVRLGLLTDDGASIAMAYTGLLCIDPAAVERFRRRQPVALEETYIRTTPRFETSAPQYDWLNRIIAVGVGGAPGTHPTYQVFQIL